jgi:TatA/E family protein of Tat protein translocase
LFTGGLEFGFLLFIAFLLFGPKKLPEIARTLGKGMAELRRASNELKSSLEEEIRNLDRAPEGHADVRTHDVAAPLPKYGDYHSEPASDDATTRQ